MSRQRLNYHRRQAGFPERLKVSGLFIVSDVAGYFADRNRRRMPARHGQHERHKAACLAWYYRNKARALKAQRDRRRRRHLPT